MDFPRVPIRSFLIYCSFPTVSTGIYWNLSIFNATGTFDSSHSLEETILSRYPRLKRGPAKEHLPPEARQLMPKILPKYRPAPLQPAR